MKKALTLTLTTLRYSGDSIGNDIHIDGEVFGRKFSFTRKIKRGETVRIDTEIGRTETDSPSIAVPLTFRVTEKDFLFPDIGQKTETMIVDLNGARVQNKVITVEVREKKLRAGKRKALFDITCQAIIQKDQAPFFANKSIVWWEEWKTITQYSYRGINGKEDYNRYDSIIKNVVAKWNKEFCDDLFPPDEPLDPNFVKAMIYIESRMGYFQSGDYPAYPDVMQVADVRNPAIHTLNNDGWKNKKGVLAQEREWSKGNILILNYHGEAKGTSPKESIVWGARWLYHRAQGITHESTRYWRSWKEAVALYNGDGNEQYGNEVYDVYLRGIDRRIKKHTIQLFSIGILLVVSFSFALFGAQAFIKEEQQSSQGSAYEILPHGAAQGLIPQNVRHMMNEKMQRYERQDHYYYGDLFRDAVLLCRQHEDECFADYIFSSYLPDILSRSRDIHAFLEVIQPFNTINASNSFFDDLDNDGEAELVAVLMDVLNHERLEILVVDPYQTSLHVARSTIRRMYNGGPPRVIDLTGDSIPEIVVFSSGGRQDIQLYVFQYIQGELKQLLSLERGYLRADIIFTDQNHNHLPEIKVKGEQYGDECMACEHKKIEEFFEYHPESKSFKQITKKVFLTLW